MEDILENPGKIPESIILNHVVLMAQQSLDPEYYDMFCRVHDRLVDIRRLTNKKLG